MEKNSQKTKLQFTQRQRFSHRLRCIRAFQVVLAVRNPPANAGDNRGADLIPESERSLGGGNRFQYFCLGNPTDRGAWWPTVHGVAKEWDMT